MPPALKTIRKLPEGERTVLRKLIARHGDDFAAMARDAKLNALQHTEASGVAIPAADVRVMPVGFVHEGPCAFDASSPSCPADKPVQCKLGDATNNTQRCVAHGGGRSVRAAR